MIGDALTALTRRAARRPLLTLTLVLVLALAGGGAASRLQPTAATDTLVSSSSQSYAATQLWHQRFGDDAVIVMVREPLHSLLFSNDLVSLLGLEGCLSGNLPAGQAPPGGNDGPCAQIAREHATKFVFGPATFIYEFAREIDGLLAGQLQATEAAANKAAATVRRQALDSGLSSARASQLAGAKKNQVDAGFAESLAQVSSDYGLGTEIPSLQDPQFVAQLAFGSTTTPKAKFSSLFPNTNTAIVQIRLKSSISQAQRARALSLIRAAVAMGQWKLAQGSYLVTGLPVIVSDLAQTISHSLALLAVISLLVMALTLGLVFRAPRRLLPLAVAVIACGLTFGVLALSGAPLTMASIAVFPVLIGLGVDYAIQFQVRVAEANVASVRGAIELGVRRGAPTVALACAATAAGFGVLALPVIGSPVPMVRDFGALLVVGVLLAFVCALTVGAAVFALRPSDRLRARWAPLAPSFRGAGEILIDNRLVVTIRTLLTRGARSAFAYVLDAPLRVVVLAIALAVLGWGLTTQTQVQSNIQKLVPQSLPSLHALNVLQNTTNVGGEIDVMVNSNALLKPATVKWMVDYQERVLARFGYSATRGCGDAILCPAFSLPDLFQTQSDIAALLAVIPEYFSQGVITADHRSATLAFGIRLMSLADEEKVITTLRADLHPPAGVSATLVGLPVLAADANAQISSPWRRLLTLLAGLAAVALVLGLALRSRRRALLPLAPIVLATGWSALVLFMIGVPLNPMSVTLGVLVIAIATEFSVLLAERYREERHAGHRPHEALGRTYSSTGAAVLASGVTATAGFGVLIASNIQMLRDFGVVTVVDLAVALAGVMLVLPAVLLLSETADGKYAKRNMRESAS